MEFIEETINFNKFKVTHLMLILFYAEKKSMKI